MAGSHGGAPEAVLDRLLDAVRTFAGGVPPGDDITAMVVRIAGDA